MLFPINNFIEYSKTNSRYFSNLSGTYSNASSDFNKSLHNQIWINNNNSNIFLKIIEITKDYYFYNNKCANSTDINNNNITDIFPFRASIYSDNSMYSHILEYNSYIDQSNENSLKHKLSWYINEEEPPKLTKEDKDKIHKIMFTWFHPLKNEWYPYLHNLKNWE